MLQFVEKPNLPKGRVRLLLAGEEYLPMLQLHRYGAAAIGIGKSDLLAPAEASHADMQVVHLYRENLLIAPQTNCKVNTLYNYKENAASQNCYKALCLYSDSVKIFAGCTSLSEKYPKCAAYNVLLLDNLAFYNSKSIDLRLLENLKALKYRLIPVHQGYTRCSVCVVQNDAAITADEGIASALEKQKIDVLRIRPGFIDLPGYDYGFIGGASFKIASDLLAFTGHLRNHPDADRIELFIKSHGVTICTLTDRPIFDIGSAIPVVEEIGDGSDFS